MRLRLWRIRHQRRRRARFRREYADLRRQPKILYATTPNCGLKNIGDQAQAVAIRAWLDRHAPHLPVIEVDKKESIDYLSVLRELMRPQDLVLLHSGGNLGDRWLWSEEVRRRIIEAFPGNRVVSLPQTIFFSDTPEGRHEEALSRRIYNAHPNLTIIGRDPHSGELAAELFPNAETFAAPDFVLSLPPRDATPPRPEPSVLFCLRRDKETVLTEPQRRKLEAALPYATTRFDTTIEEEIPRDRRRDILDRTLDLFHGADAVVTDRYHGLIFAVLCRRPCVVIPTVDHKLTSAFEWFSTVRFIRLARRLEDVPSLVDECLHVPDRDVPDWNTEHFDPLAERLRIAAPEP